MSDFNLDKAIKDTAETLEGAGVSAEEAREMATKMVNRMGLTKIETGQCPLGAVSALACSFCMFGHLTDCHHPFDCEEANCSHYQAQAEYE